MFAFHNNQRDHDNQSSSQTVNESLAIPPHMGFQDLSQEHDTFEPDDNVIELGLGLGMRRQRTRITKLLTPLTLMLNEEFLNTTLIGVQTTKTMDTTAIVNNLIYNYLKIHSFFF